MVRALASGRGLRTSPSLAANRALASGRLKSQFSLLDLSPALWLKADGALWQNFAATIPAVSDGDPISRWSDASVNGNDVTQSSAGSRPLLKLSIQNGLPIVRFDGVNDNLNALFTLIPPEHVFAVFSLRSLGALGVNDTVIDSGTGGGSNFGLLLGVDNTPQSYIYSGVVCGVSFAICNNVFGQVNAVFNGTSSRLSLNGLQIATGNVGTRTAGGITLGGHSVSGANCTAVDFAEVILFSAVQSYWAQSNIVSYLRQKWGLP